MTYSCSISCFQSCDNSVTQPPKCNETISSELSAEHMYTTIDSIRKRLKARLTLHAQLTNLLHISSTR